MTKKEIEKIMEICSYYSDDQYGGSGGYELSSEQLQKLINVIDQLITKAKEEERERIKKLAIDCSFGHRDKTWGDMVAIDYGLFIKDLNSQEPKK